VKLEEVTAELRPRSEWEAIDLGLALVRRDFWRLSGAWWLGMLPVLLFLPVAHEHPFLFLFAFWWWIPTASRMALFLLSRVLFGASVGSGELWRELPRAIVRRRGYRLLWARLSPWRPLTLPVEDLEGLRGKDYGRRCAALMRRGDSTVIMLAMWRVFLGLWLMLILFATFLLFLPEGTRMEWILTLEIFFDGGGWEAPGAMSMTMLGVFCLSCWLVDLFATGCGFGIYVNHRSWIEGWDVELAFRRLGRRLAGLAGGMVMVAAVCLHGDLRAEEPEKVIAEVLQHPDFVVHTKTTKQWTGWDWPDFLGAGIGEAFGFVLQALFWSAIVAFLLFLIYRFRHLFRVGSRAASSKSVVRPPRVIMGMEVSAESLPADVPGAALEAWRAGRGHEALSLLYRGSISWMIRDGGIGIAESDTESDCLARVREGASEHESYFSRVTELWMSLAYGRMPPADDQVESLCAGWPFMERGRT
jgi:hypothetical protein